MDNLSGWHKGLSRAWDQLTEGWQELRERASHALTRFYPRRTGNDVETVSDQLSQYGPGWGMLAAEVSDDGSNIEVRLEVPGMEPDGFDLHVNDDLLIIRGEKHAEREGEQGRFYLMERAYGRFERVVPLPAAVDDSRAKAKYRRGVLTVKLPKVSGSVARRIEVNRG